MSFSASSVVALSNATIHQEYRPVLENVNFSIDKGEFVYLLGQTGSGKSSLLKTLYADIPLHEGSAIVTGVEINNVNRKEVPALRRQLGIIFQDFELFTDRSVVENLEFVLKATGWKSNAKIKQRISEVLMRVGLESSSNKFPHQLSGGEQQRIVIARALLNEPALLVADEPTGNLDPNTALSILELFREINRSGTSIIMATHNHTFLDKYPERFLLCSQGEVKDSTKEEITLSQYSYS